MIFLNNICALLNVLSIDCMTLLQNKLEGTLWVDLDDSRVFKILDLEDIERTFSAYQRQQVVFYYFSKSLVMPVKIVKWHYRFDCFIDEKETFVLIAVSPLSRKTELLKEPHNEINL